LISTFCIINYDNNNLVTNETTTKININGLTTPAPTYENFDNITTEASTTFDIRVLK
jgi:hypothetical protein